jgi:type I restriction enzyme, S subunit
MNVAELITHFKNISDAPHAIPSLRRFVLDLAVRGRLVSQDPKDEPAFELLKRIASEKVRIDGGRPKRGRLSDSRERSDDFEFTPPPGWAISTLGDTTLKITDGTHQTPTYVSSGVPFVSVKDFSAGQLDLSNTRFITEEEHCALYKRCDPRRGDILIGRIGTLGHAVLVDTDTEFSLFVSVGLIRFSHKNIVPDFFRLLLDSPLVEGEFNRIKIGGGTHTNKLNLSDLQTVALPLPPLAEQRRIVDKVGELMALCDRLEAARAERENRRDRLAAGSLSRLNTPDPGSFRDDARFALDALPALTTRPDQLKQLRQSVLNLAMLGKLVPQDPNDEPASELLSRIRKEKKSSQEIRKTRRNGEIELSSLRAGTILPFGWQWTNIDEIALSMRYGTSTKCEFSDSGSPVLRIPNVSSGFVTLDNLKFGPLTESEAHDLALSAGDLLMIRSNGSLDIVGRSAVVTAEAEGMAFAGYLVRLRLSLSNLNAKYLWLAMNSTSVRDQIERPIRSAVGLKNVNLTEFGALIFPLPPLSEQSRIVAKVDEIMALCGRLETSLRTSADRQHRLLTALLNEALLPIEEHAEAA